MARKLEKFQSLLLLVSYFYQSKRVSWFRGGRRGFNPYYYWLVIFTIWNEWFRANMIQEVSILIITG